MSMRGLFAVLLGAAMALTGLSSNALAQSDDSVFFPLLVYRTGPYAPSGIPTANGMHDYLRLVNARGGINGVPIEVEECETQYNTKLGVECYEKLKNKGSGAAVINPYSTGITYQLIPKARVDEIPIHSLGYGRTAAAYGKVFKWTFNFPDTYWHGASAAVRYIGQEEGGMESLNGKTIALVYHNSAYGKEPIPTLEKLAEDYGYNLELLAVDHPGQEQKSTWLQVRRMRPDWVVMWGWGVMNQVAVKEAANINFPMDHFIGVWWSGDESTVVPAGEDAVGYKAMNFHGVGTDFGVHEAIIEEVYGGDRAAAEENNFGEVLYNRGIINAMYDVEAVRTAMNEYGNKPLTGEQYRWGFENLNLTQERINELGMQGLVQPLRVTCENHAVGAPIMIQQWDGEKWNPASDWLEPMSDVVWAQAEEAALAYAEENNIEVRDCN